MLGARSPSGPPHWRRGAIFRRAQADTRLKEWSASSSTKIPAVQDHDSDHHKLSALEDLNNTKTERAMRLEREFENIKGDIEEMKRERNDAFRICRGGAA